MPDRYPAPTPEDYRIKQIADGSAIRNLQTMNDILNRNLEVANAEIVRLRHNGREAVAAWIMKQGYATGHGDTIEDLLFELEEQIVDRTADRYESAD